jgi:Holliday junction resolvase RusA-like endonuclease
MHALPVLPRAASRGAAAVLRLTVYGTPAPQGSTKAFVPKGWKRPIITADCKRTKPWRQAIVDAVRADLGPAWVPLDCPCTLRVVFYLPRPASAPKRVMLPSKLPDLDKLVRAVGDALTAAGVWKDDARVVGIEARKQYAAGVFDPMGDSGIPRAAIEVRSV